MAKTISTAGSTPFEVTVAPTVPGMVRFVRALTRTGAVSRAQAGSSKPGSPLVFLVWLNPMSIAMFKAFCDPLRFQFLASDAIKTDGTVDPEKLLKG